MVLTERTSVGTFTAADPNATFGHDEPVFMAADLRGLVPVSDPAGVVGGSGVEVTVTDLLDDDTADPRRGRTNVFRWRRSVLHLPPGATAAEADLASQRTTQTLAATTRNRA